MGNIFRFFLFSIFLQPIFLHAQKHFDERWKKIDSLMKGKGLTRTASVEVERVYQIAKKEKNETQAIKALIYKIYLNETLEENSIQVNAEALKEEIRIAGEPSASILKSLLAGIYWGYFQDHRWNLYNRTALSQNNQHDPATWSIADFNKNISALFLESVKKEQLLIQTTLASLSPIITRGNAHYLRPTLFDLLAHRALNYFKAGEFNLVRPSYNFELSDPGALSPAAKFIIWQFKTQDSTSLQAKAILIFQDLIKLHMLDAKPEALIDVDIERITFVHDNGTMPNKEHLYMDALKSITERYPENPIAAKSWYFQAIYFSELAESYKSRRDTTNRYANLQAKEICERVIRQKDSSEGKSACESLLNKILRHELHLQAEKVNSPGRPFRISVTYKSLNKVYLRLIKSDPGQTAFYLQESRDEAWWKKLVQMPAFRNLEQPLPDPRDYQTHRTEIKMDALEPGEYILIGTDQLDFSLGEHPLVMQIFYVSAISYINSGEDYFVLHRETGQPLEGISVQVWNQHYDNTSGKWLEVKGEKYFTDPHGHFKLAKPEKNLGLRRKLELSGKGDGLFLRDDASSISYIRFPEIAESDKEAYEKNNRQTFFFTDRSIYRPGQSIFFKGIALTRDFESGKPRILAKFNTTIFLNDVNNQKIDSLVLTTNEFGSYHGKFILPSGKLTGTFSIEDGITGSGQPFSVEEYKRPRFLVRFEKPKAEWRINDKLKIPGNAKAYAGNAIDGATVKYSISRRYGLPSPLGDNQWPKPISGYEIISQGETKTRADGSFEIEFTAKPEPFVSKEMNPIFDFEVSAEVTDNSGETRSGQTQLRLGYQSLFLNIEAGPLVMDSVGILNEIQIRTTNSMRSFESAKIQLSIFRIETPNRLIRPRYWEASDQFVLTEKEYVNYFPHDEYKNESQPENWPVESMIFSTTDTTKAEKGISLRAQRFSPGWYLFEASTKDKYGEEIKQKQYIEIEDILSRSSSFPAYIGYTDQLQILQPGDTARIGFASSADSVFVVRQINRLKPAYSFSSLNHGYETMKVPIEETDRGGLELSIAFVKDNRIYMASQKIDVPWINKELKITYSSYREKILPGAGDKWKIKIEGFKKDWVASEILSSMYDASLDQFRPHVWYIPGIYPSHDLTRSWEGYLNFSLSWDQEWNSISSNLQDHLRSTMTICYF